MNSAAGHKKRKKFRNQLKKQSDTLNAFANHPLFHQRKTFRNQQSLFSRFVAILPPIPPFILKYLIKPRKAIDPNTPVLGMRELEALKPLNLSSLERFHLLALFKEMCGGSEKHPHHTVSYRAFVRYFRFTLDIWIKRLFELINSQSTGSFTFLEFVCFLVRYLIIDSSTTQELSFRLLSRRGSLLTFSPTLSILDYDDLYSFFTYRYEIEFPSLPLQRKVTLDIFSFLNSNQDGGINFIEFLTFTQKNAIFLKLSHPLQNHLRKCIFGLDSWVEKTRKLKLFALRNRLPPIGHIIKLDGGGQQEEETAEEIQEKELEELLAMEEAMKRSEKTHTSFSFRMKKQPSSAAAAGGGGGGGSSKSISFSSSSSSKRMKALKKQHQSKLDDINNTSMSLALLITTQKINRTSEMYTLLHIKDPVVDHTGNPLTNQAHYRVMVHNNGIVHHGHHQPRQTQIGAEQLGGGQQQTSQQPLLTTRQPTTSFAASVNGEESPAATPGVNAGGLTSRNLAATAASSQNNSAAGSALLASSEYGSSSWMSMGGGASGGGGGGENNGSNAGSGSSSEGEEDDEGGEDGEGGGRRRKKEGDSGLEIDGARTLQLLLTSGLDATQAINNLKPHDYRTKNIYPHSFSMENCVVKANFNKDFPEIVALRAERRHQRRLQELHRREQIQALSGAMYERLVLACSDLLYQRRDTRKAFNRWLEKAQLVDLHQVKVKAGYDRSQSHRFGATGDAARGGHNHGHGQHHHRGHHHKGHHDQHGQHDDGKASEECENGDGGVREDDYSDLDDEEDEEGGEGVDVTPGQHHHHHHRHHGSKAEDVLSSNASVEEGSCDLLQDIEDDGSSIVTTMITRDALHESILKMSGQQAEKREYDALGDYHREYLEVNFISRCKPAANNIDYFRQHVIQARNVVADFG